MNEKQLKDILCEVRCQAIKCAIISLICEVLRKCIFCSKKSKVIIDKDVPAEIVAIGKSKGPAVVYVSSKKKKRFNLFPAIACISVAGICQYLICKKLKG